MQAGRFMPGAGVTGSRSKRWRRRDKELPTRVSSGRAVCIVFRPIRSCFDFGTLLKQLFEWFIFVEQHAICQQASVVVG